MRGAALWCGLAILPLVACGEEPPETQLLIAPEGEGQVLRLSVTEIRNPQMVPFGVILESADGVAFGRVAVFPPDQPGVFRLSLTKEQQARAKEGVRVRVEPFEAGGDVRAETELAFE